MNKIYFYKMKVDNLGAPHVAGRMLTLALCKPAIRRRAGKGDYIFGFGGKNLGGRLIYVAVVTDTRSRDYYSSNNMRADSIYLWRGNDFALKPNACYHTDGSHFERDLGAAPTFENAHILLSDDFRYYGKNGSIAYIDECPRLADRLMTLSQGHRVHHSPALRAELLRLKEKLWAAPQSKAVVPSNPIPDLDDDDENDTHEC